MRWSIALTRVNVTSNILNGFLSRKPSSNIERVFSSKNILPEIWPESVAGGKLEGTNRLLFCWKLGVVFSGGKTRKSCVIGAK